MSYRSWWAARRLLFDEKYGPLIRQAEAEQRQREAELASDYARSRKLLQGSPDGDR